MAMHISRLKRSANAQLDSTTSNLPAALQNSVPYCAANCISSYIGQEFACAPSDLSCLCTKYSTTGYTLGELAYGCLMVNCSEPPSQLQASLYSICNSQQGFAASTHTALVLPQISTTTTRSVSSSTTSARTSSTPTASVVTTATSPTLTASAAAAPNRPGGLTSAQAVGVSVAALGVIMLAGVVVFLILYLRKRRSRRTLQPEKSSYDFVDEGPPKDQPFEQKKEVKVGYVHPRLQQSQTTKIPPAWYGRDEEDRKREDARKRKSQTVRQVNTQTQKQKQSRRSNESTRTISQLLPEKPWPSPPLKGMSERTPVAASPATVFDDSLTPLTEPLPSDGSYPIPRAAGVERPADGVVYPERRPAAVEAQGLHAIEKPATSLSRPTRRLVAVDEPVAGLTQPPQRLDSLGKPAPVVLAGPMHNTSRQSPSQQLPPVLLAGHVHSTLRQSPSQQPPSVILAGPMHNTSRQSPSQQPPSVVLAGHIHNTSRQSPSQQPPPVLLAGHIHNTSRQSPSRQPPLSLDIPRTAARSPRDRVRPADQVPPPVEPLIDLLPPFTINHYAPNAPASPPQARYYITNDSRSPETPTPIDDEQQRRRVIPANIKVPKQVCPERAVRSSGGSDTSFESTDPDEPTPPVEKSLTPVVESPVRYPKIPRSSNQAIPRSPQAPITPQSTVPRVTTPSRARHPGNILQEQSQPESNVNATLTGGSKPQYRRMPGQDSPLRGYGRTTHVGLPANPRDKPSQRAQHDRTMALRSPTTPNLKNQEATVQSPIWEQKLTPSRRGDDLFLSVSMASPGVAPNGWSTQRKI